jgi:hypothetical protein
MCVPACQPAGRRPSRAVLGQVDLRVVTGLGAHGCRRGFGGLVLPAGAYVVTGSQVRWVPAVDMTIVVLASLSLVRVLARTWTRSRRHHGRS